MKSKSVRHLLIALAATVACAAQLQAQTGEIRGRVVDASLLAPLGDVTVTVAGQTVLSEAQGFFVVSDVPAGIHTLQARVIGYRPFEIQVTVIAGETADVAVEMQIAPMEMEPIVAIGYGEQDTRDVTGVVTEVPTEAFNTGRVISAEELIRAKVAGVQVTEANRGEPGGGISIRIRGGTSVTASNEPLYVIDGVIIPVGGGLSAGRNPLNFLNPADIESFTVLKDASATAIYGSQGANGVVLIETTAGRRAAATGVRATYQGNISGSNVAARPDILSASQFEDVVADQAPDRLPMLGTDATDWQKAIERSAFGQEHTLAVGGGTDKMNFRVSLGYLNQEGVVRASETERVSLNFAYNQLLFNDRLSLQASILGARNEDLFTPGLVIGAATRMAPTQPIEDAASPYGGYFEWTDPISTKNPIAELDLVRDEGTTYRSIGNVTGEYSLPWLDGLSATARLGYNATNSERRFFAPSVSKSQADGDFPGEVSRSNPTEFGWLVDAFLTYRGNWDQHGLDLTGGYAYSQLNNDTPFSQSLGLSTDLLGISGIPSADERVTTLFVEETRLASWFARANYSFRDRYLVTATIRTDGSSKFAVDDQWATFPSIAGAWRISSENFMQNAGSLSDLKLRVSWGKNGNSAFDSYQQYKDYVFGDAFTRAQFGDEFVATARPSGADPNIKWEATESWNFGLDYGFSNNRYWGSIEYYTKSTDDLLFEVPVAAGTNLSNQVITNVGSMKNSGVEATLNAMLLQGTGDGFTWDANLNVAYNKNELTEVNPFGQSVEEVRVGGISGGVGRTIQVLTPGEPVNSFFVWEHKRDGSGNPIYEDVDGNGTIDEQDLYVDSNGDGTINEDDKSAFKSPNPDWLIGHTSLMRYKDFDFSLTLLAQIGNYVYNNVASDAGNFRQLTFSAAPSNLHASVLDNNFDVPQYDSDVYVEDAGFLRMENIELGYTFRRWLSGVRVYAVVQNVFTLTGYSGVDPTAGINGIDNNLYPRTRTFTAGLNVTF
jgi:iron complex outermembrane receptor protein